MAFQTYYIDISGRITQNSNRITTAAVALSNADESVIKDFIVNKKFPKWRNATIKDVNDIITIILKYQLTCAVFQSTVFSKEAKLFWANFWGKGIDFLNKAYIIDKVSLKELKSPNVLKYYFLGRCISLLIATRMKTMRKIIYDSHGLKIMRFNIISDTDIQGEENQKFFKYLWEEWSKKTRIKDILGFLPVINEITFETEQDEPLLILPDYLAGLFNWDKNMINNLPFHQNEIDNHKSLIKDGLNILFNFKKEPFKEIYPLDFDPNCEKLILKW
jgi:hypothetical protein